MLKKKFSLNKNSSSLLLTRFIDRFRPHCEDFISLKFILFLKINIHFLKQKGLTIKIEFQCLIEKVLLNILNIISIIEAEL